MDMGALQRQVLWKQLLLSAAMKTWIPGLGISTNIHRSAGMTCQMGNRLWLAVADKVPGVFALSFPPSPHIHRTFSAVPPPWDRLSFCSGGASSLWQASAGHRETWAPGTPSELASRSACLLSPGKSAHSPHSLSPSRALEKGLRNMVKQN